MNSILEFEPIKKFISVLGPSSSSYFGDDAGCIIGVYPDGIFYGTALYQWLKQKKFDIAFTAMDAEGNSLEKEKLKGRKVLIVDNDIVTGRAYKRAMEVLRLKKEELSIKDIKFATFFDRVGVADFFVTKYSPEAIWHLDELDAVDLKIIGLLAHNGRASFAEIGKKIHLSSVAVKNRVDKLLAEKILRVQAALSIDQFYTMSAEIGIEAEEKTVVQLIERFEKMEEVYQLVKAISGRYNLIVGFLAHNLENIEKFLENEIRAVPGVKRIDVFLGEIPVAPKTIAPWIRSLS